MAGTTGAISMPRSPVPAPSVTSSLRTFMCCPHRCRPCTCSRAMKYEKWVRPLQSAAASTPQARGPGALMRKISSMATPMDIGRHRVSASPRRFARRSILLAKSPWWQLRPPGDLDRAVWGRTTDDKRPNRPLTATEREHGIGNFDTCISA